MDRKILIGLIISTNYIKQIRGVFDIALLESATARLMAGWCIVYFDKYEKAPFRDIKGLFQDALMEGSITDDIAEEIEEEILPSLNDEYESIGNFNVNYLIDKTNQWINQKNLEQFNEKVEAYTERGQVEEAQKAISDFKGTVIEETALSLHDRTTLAKIEHAFNNTYQTVIEYPGALGEFWNEHMIRGGFVGITAPEKRGKTFQLLDMMIRGVKQKAKVAFVQAGDMTEAQQLKRICIYLAKKSDKPQYCGEQYIPIKDCIHNQLDTCTKRIRESDFGIFEMSEEDLKKEITFDLLKEAYEDNPGYNACHNCSEFKQNRWGTPYLKKINVKGPLEVKEALQKYENFFIKNKRYSKLASYPNGTLSISMLNSLLDTWEMQEDFVPDVLIIDYADLMFVPNTEFRHGQNDIWKALRAISQKNHCLVVTPTQADAASYKQDTLTLTNFSEDKRKYAHVTAMFGLNQDKDGREKKIGLLRINKLIIREGDNDNNQQVTVLQKLAIGRPVLGSFWT